LLTRVTRVHVEGLDLEVTETDGGPGVPYHRHRLVVLVVVDPGEVEDVVAVCPTDLGGLIVHPEVVTLQVTKKLHRSRDLGCILQVLVVIAEDQVEANALQEDRMKEVVPESIRSTKIYVLPAVEDITEMNHPADSPLLDLWDEDVPGEPLGHIQELRGVVTDTVVGVRNHSDFQMQNPFKRACIFFQASELTRLIR